MRVFTRPVANALKIQCRWCKAAAGSRCVVRGTQRPLRNADGEFCCHPTRLEDLQEVMDRAAAEAPEGEEILVDAVDL